MWLDPEDVHAKLMCHYPEVPDWWYHHPHLYTIAVGAILPIPFWLYQ